MSYGRTLAVTALAALMLGAAATAAPNGGHHDTWRSVLGDAAGHALAAITGTVDGITAAREARRAYRRDRSYAAPFPAPYYPYPNGYPYW